METALTFLFTDIPDSILLWEQFPRTMLDVVTKQIALYETAIRTHGGKIQRSHGEADNTFAVFQSADSALRAVLEFQCTLRQPPPFEPNLPLEEPELRRREGRLVRAAIHTGYAEVVAGDYNSPDVNRCARLRSLAKGGQILVSAAVAQSLAEPLPNGMTLVAIGSHRLKDLPIPESVFQVSHPDLPSVFGSASHSGIAPTNLSTTLPPLIGRNPEMQTLTQSILHYPTVVVYGMCGVGKSRLVLHTVANLRPQFADGVWHIEMDGITQSREAIEKILGAFGCGNTNGYIARLTELVTNKHLLLVLDNCDLMQSELSALHTLLVDLSPCLRIVITTSRAYLLDGSVSFVLSPFQVPKASDDAAILQESDCIRLFLFFAQAVRPDFQIHASNAKEVVEICQKLDGNPLAISLAAARLNTLSLEQLHSRIGQMFQLLHHSRRSTPARHSSLKSAVEWDIQRLTDDERRQLHLLATQCPSGVLHADAESLGSLAQRGVLRHDTSGNNVHLSELISAYHKEFLVQPNQTSVEGA